MSVSLEESTITGAISTATSYPSSGQEPTRETFRTIGDVKNTLGPFVDKYGLKVSLNKHSRWVVTQTSYLTGLTLANGAAISAAEGSKVTMLVNGATTPIKAGNYTGKIEMRVSK
jgi:hypothetical protein